MLRWLKLLRRTDSALQRNRAVATPELEALRKQGEAFLQADELDKAAACYTEVLQNDGADANALTRLAYIRMQQGRPEDATAHLHSAIRSGPVEPDAHYMLGTLAESNGNLDLARQHLEATVDLNPNFDFAVRDLARVLFMVGERDRSRRLLEQSIIRNPRFAAYHFYLGNLYFEANEPRKAVGSYAAAIELESVHLGALIQMGTALDRLGELEDAAAAFQGALLIEPVDAMAHRGLANVQMQLGRVEAAVASLEAALTTDPQSADTLANLGHALLLQGSFSRAAETSRKALAIDPNHAGACNNLGNALVHLNLPQLALGAYERALAIKPDYAEALVNLSVAFNLLKRPRDSMHALERALVTDSHAPWLYGSWIHARLRVCNWLDIDGAFRELALRIENKEPVATPWAVLAAPLTAAQQRTCAESYIRRMSLPDVPTPAITHGHERIRLGYFSADFHGHATAYLMAELFEHHDRDRFEVIAFSFGPDSTHPMRSRLVNAFDQFIDVKDKTDTAIVEHARSLKIDIAIDLKGFTEDARTGIFAQRAAPIQVSYIGFPGTMGAPFIDYLVADRIVIPDDAVDAYTEKIIYLPDSFQANDSKRTISESPRSRVDWGLPEQGFVFCCFNNNYKITPDVFEVWMRLLQSVPDSVLWLLQDNDEAAQNLRRHARHYGVAPERLIFAPRVEMPDHLARHRHADLFLDTLHCNAHTTASDALWAGLPVLTCLGASFAGRVAGSLLHAVGLSELVVEALPDYERLARDLATNPERLKALRERLARNRATYPLFDSTRLATHIEQAYEMIWKRRLAGLPNDHVHVAQAH